MATKALLLSHYTRVIVALKDHAAVLEELEGRWVESFCTVKKKQQKQTKQNKNETNNNWFLEATYSALLEICEIWVVLSSLFNFAGKIWPHACCPCWKSEFLDFVAQKYTKL